jgi:ATP-binding cassette subfamily B protein
MQFRPPAFLVIKLQNFTNLLAYLPRTIGLIWTAARGWTVAWGILLVLQGLLPAVAVYLTRVLVDNLVPVIGAGISWERVRPTLLLGALLAGVMIVTELLQSVSRLIRSTQAELVRDHLSALIHQKSTAVDLAFYESPIYHDRLERARNDLNNRPLALLESSGSMAQNMITLSAMAALLTPYGIWLPCILLVGTSPVFYMALRFHRRHHHWWEKTTVERRRTQYYDMLLTDSGVAPELRAFDLGPYFRSVYGELRRKLRDERLKLSVEQSIGLVGAGLISVLIFASTMAWMGWRALHGLASLGDLVLFYQAFSRGQILIRSVLENLGQIFVNVLFVGNIFEFLGLDPRVVDPSQPLPPPLALRQGIHFQDVTFRYPGSDKPAVQNFNLTIPAGQIVAIVGANGAGKSTLIKLLCRFYDPQAGCIRLEGIDIRELSLQELRRMITVLFQWLVPYQTSAAQNIALGDLSIKASSAELEVAARAAGAHEIISRLPEGYNTLLGKWFANGTELSMGEWQRIALARAFLRRAQIIMLDEPTSALDSWAEAEWFQRFRALAKGRTAIIITHRFTIARRADMIHVMDEGRIVESGTHEDLLRLGGFYSQAWFTQVQDRADLDQSRIQLGTPQNAPQSDNGVSRM